MNTITLNGAVIEIPEGFRIAEMRPIDNAKNDYHIRLTPDNTQYSMYPDEYYQKMQAANVQGFYPSLQYDAQMANIAKRCGSNQYRLNRLA